MVNRESNYSSYKFYENLGNSRLLSILYFRHLVASCKHTSMIQVVPFPLGPAAFAERMIPAVVAFLKVTGTQLVRLIFMTTHRFLLARLCSG